MNAAVVKLATLRDLIEAKSVRAASIVGSLGGWAIAVRYGQAERVLADKNGRPRTFTKLDTAARQLLDLGLVSFEVHGADYEAAPARVKRPDRSTAMRSAHDYARWLRAEVQSTVDALAKGEMPLYSEAEMDAHWAKKRTEIVRRRRESHA